MGILSYIARRTLLASFVLFGVIVITFVLSHSISSNPIVAWLGKAAGFHPEMVQAYIQKYHLNDPIHVRFGYYIIGILHGDFGYSWSRGDYVLNVLGKCLPYSLQIAFFAIVITLVLGIPLGVIACKYYNRGPDHAIRTFYLAGISSPAFFVALILLMVFTYVLRILPSGGYISPEITPPSTITGFIILDSLIEGNWPSFFDTFKHVMMPSMALALGNFGYVVRVLRASLLEVMRTNYIRTARAKGLDERTVFLKHALRNSLMPVITLASLITIWLVSGTLFVESVFAYPGIGHYFVQALGMLDYAAILAITLVLTVIMVTANLVADILYAIANPEIEL